VSTRETQRHVAAEIATDEHVMSEALVTDGGSGAGKIRYLSSGVAFLALGTVAVGCFLPTADAGSVTWDRLHENSLRASGIAWLTVSLCVVVGAALAVSLYRGRRTLGPLVGGLLVLAEAAYLGAAELSTCPVGVAVVDGAVCQTASPGIGLFALAAGGGALAIAGPHLATLAPKPPKRLAAEHAPDRVPGQLEPDSVEPPTAIDDATLKPLQQRLRAGGGRVDHEADFKGYYMYVSETVFIASARSHDHGFELRDGEWVPFTPDTRPADLEWLVTLADAAEWKGRAAPQARPA
jgi:hypothetical protein